MMKDCIAVDIERTGKNQSDFSKNSEIHPSEVNNQLRQLLHDFQQPLTVILATSQLMQLRNLDETTLNDIDLIIDAASELEYLSIQMRDFIHKNDV